MYRIIIESEDDIYIASSIGKKVAKDVGLHTSEQTKLVVSIMELTRNIILYANKGELLIKPSTHRIEIIAIDQGPGIKNLDTILKQTYSSKTGLGLGVTGVKRLMDEFYITSEVNQGTTVRAVKWLNNGGK